MNKVAVIGSNSFTGSHCADSLLDEGYNVIGLSRSPEYNRIFLPYAYKKEISPNFKFYQLDINTQLDKIMQLLDKEKPEVIINFIALSDVIDSWKYSELYFRTNCLGAIKLANELKDRKYVECYIHTSTVDVYGISNKKLKENYTYYPTTSYAASKAAADLFLTMLEKSSNFPLTLIRPTTIYGTHQQLYRIIPRIIIYLKFGKKVPLHGGGKAIKSFIHVCDVIDGIIRIISLKNPSNLYHFSASEKGRTIASVAKLICEKMGKDFNECTAIVPERAGQIRTNEIDSSRAHKELKWKPKVKFEKGIEEVVDWINKCWDTIKNLRYEYVHKP